MATKTPTKTAGLAALVADYATISAEISRLKDRQETLKDQIEPLLQVGQQVEGPDYTLTKAAGRNSKTWRDKAEQAKIEEALIAKGILKITAGSPYLKITWKRDGADE